VGWLEWSHRYFRYKYVKLYFYFIKTSGQMISYPNYGICKFSSFNVYGKAETDRKVQRRATQMLTHVRKYSYEDRLSFSNSNLNLMHTKRPWAWLRQSVTNRLFTYSLINIVTLSDRNNLDFTSMSIGRLNSAGLLVYSGWLCYQLWRLPMFAADSCVKCYASFPRRQWDVRTLLVQQTASLMHDALPCTFTALI